MRKLADLIAHAPRLAAWTDRYPGELGCEWHWREWRMQRAVDTTLTALGIPLDRRQRVAVALMWTLIYFLRR